MSSIIKLLMKMNKWDQYENEIKHEVLKWKFWNVKSHNDNN